MEVRRLSITNRGDRPREIEVTSYAEIVLGASRGRPRAPGVRQAVHRDRVRRRRAPACSSAAGRERRTRRRLGLPRARRRGPARRRGRMGNRSRAIPRPRTIAGQPGGARRPRAVGHRPARCSIRSRRCASACGWRPAPSSASRSRPASRRPRRRRWRWCASIATRSAASRAFSMAFTHVHITLQHLGLTDDHAMLFDRLASRVFGSDASCISPDDIAQNTLRPAESVGLRHLGRPADRAGARHRTPTRSPLVRQVLLAQEYWRVKDLRADVVILNEHPADYLDEVADASSSALVQEPRWAGWIDKPGRDVPAALRRHARRRPPPAGGRRARGARAATSAISARSSSRPAPWLLRTRSRAVDRRVAAGAAPASAAMPVPPRA